MYIKKYLFGYGLVSIGLPLGVYFAAMFCNDKIKAISMASLIIIAVIVVLFSSKVINDIFDDRDNSYVDGEFVIKVSCSLVIMFLLRYAIANISFLIPVYRDEIVQVLTAPIWFLIFIPFLKNYCLNRKTIIVTLLLSIIIVYVIIPGIIYVIGRYINNEYIVADGVYYNYYGYNIIANRAIAGICGLTGIQIPKSIVFVALQVANIIIWCIMYLPYIVITAITVDERSYMEKGYFVRTPVMIILVVLFALGIFWCSILSADGVLKLDYVLFHNL